MTGHFLWCNDMNARDATTSSPTRTYALTKSIPFFAVHAVALVGLVVMPFSWKGIAFAVGLYYLRMFGITAGYHRYFAHRTFRTGRIFQFLLAVLAVSSTQKGVLWWAAHHRLHHKLSDKPGDVHSMARDGFFWSHVGWILTRENDVTDETRITDLTRFPELRWLERMYLLPSIALGVLLAAVGGWPALFWGYFVSTVMLWHGTFLINSLCHFIGKARYRTEDDSKNSLVLAILTLGEGWHNNHHHYPRSTTQGFFWWEIDPTYYMLKVLSWVGLVWDLHVPSDAVRRKNLLVPAAPEMPRAATPMLSPISAPPAQLAIATASSDAE